MEKGWIVLDIDGTLTLDKYSIPEKVIHCLRDLDKSGWKLAFATGRPFAFASIALAAIDFPYIFIGQNGSLVLSMPEKKILFKTYISAVEIPHIEKIYETLDSDFLIYAGFEKGDFCYFRPDKFSKEDHRYLIDLQKRQKENWKQVQSFDEMDISSFPLIKCFGKMDRIRFLQEKLKTLHQFEISKIKDPFEKDYFLLLVTAKKASKGKAALKMIKRFQIKGKVIAAGDDENDVSLFGIADEKIAMEHAPKILKEKATIVAAATKDLGIIDALEKATAGF